MGTLTINTTSAQDARILTAFGKVFGLKDGDDLPRDATPAEAKQFVITYIREVVLRSERNEAAQSAAAAVPDINPT